MDEMFVKKQPEYPWQTYPPGVLGAKTTKAERCADKARFRFGFKEGLLDERRGSFRFSDGRFAFSRTHANRPASEEASFFREWVFCERRALLPGTIP